MTLLVKILVGWLILIFTILAFFLSRKEESALGRFFTSACGYALLSFLIYWVRL